MKNILNDLNSFLFAKNYTILMSYKT
jgi:hypothetical protein